MAGTDTEFIFPSRVIPDLLNLRGEVWRQRIQNYSKDMFVFDSICLVLLMVRLCGCSGCNADSFRAMKGCTYCAKLSIKRFKGSDEDLIEILIQGEREISEYLQKHSIF
jgi:hypothetical protein